MKSPIKKLDAFQRHNDHTKHTNLNIRGFIVKPLSSQERTFNKRKPLEPQNPHKLEASF